MSVNSVSNTTNTELYKDYSTKTTNTAKEEQVSSSGAQTDTFEKSQDTKKATYTINKMSAEERKALVSQLKTDQENRQKNLISIVQKMMKEQAVSYGIANNEEEDSIWKFLSDGNFTVDEETRLQAQEDISEDGYYGVKQTSQRLFDFASALAGDDVDKMKEMQAAMEKGFKEATKSWGKDLPQISQDTLDAANKLFEDYYATKMI